MPSRQAFMVVSVEQGAMLHPRAQCTACLFSFVNLTIFPAAILAVLHSGRSAEHVCSTSTLCTKRNCWLYSQRPYKPCFAPKMAVKHSAQDLLLRRRNFASSSGKSRDCRVSLAAIPCCISRSCDWSKNSVVFVYAELVFASVSVLRPSLLPVCATIYCLFLNALLAARAARRVCAHCISLAVTRCRVTHRR